MALALTAQARSPGYARAAISADGTQLIVTRADGSTLRPPRLADQAGFADAQVSGDGQYAGWLDLYPDTGASYPQPLELSVRDASNRTRRYRGKYGMVFGWCFGEQSDTVVYAYSFPHGPMSTSFDMRRLADGRLLQRFTVPDPPNPDANEDEWVRKTAPEWTLCAWSNMRKR